MTTRPRKAVPGAATRGSGLLAVFCDLEESDVAGFRPWLAEEMMPARRAIGLGPAASFDAAADAPVAPFASRPPQAFVTLYVAPRIGDLYGPAYQGLRANRSPRDTAYHRAMRNPARYVATALGDGGADGAGEFAPAMLIDRFDLAPAEVESFNMWYEAVYLPALESLPGLVRLTRYLAMEGDARHMLIHEFSDLAAAGDPEVLRLRSTGPLAHGVHASGAPGLYARVLEA